MWEHERSLINAPAARDLSPLSSAAIYNMVCLIIIHCFPFSPISLNVKFSPKELFLRLFKKVKIDRSQLRVRIGNEWYGAKQAEEGLYAIECDFSKLKSMSDLRFSDLPSELIIKTWFRLDVLESKLSYSLLVYNSIIQFSTYLLPQEWRGLVELDHFINVLSDCLRETGYVIDFSAVELGRVWVDGLEEPRYHVRCVMKFNVGDGVADALEVLKQRIVFAHKLVEGKERELRRFIDFWSREVVNISGREIASHLNLRGAMAHIISELCPACLAYILFKLSPITSNRRVCRKIMEYSGATKYVPLIHSILKDLGLVRIGEKEGGEEVSLTSAGSIVTRVLASGISRIISANRRMVKKSMKTVNPIDLLNFIRRNARTFAAQYCPSIRRCRDFDEEVYREKLKMFEEKAGRLSFLHVVTLINISLGLRDFDSGITSELISDGFISPNKVLRPHGRLIVEMSRKYLVRRGVTDAAALAWTYPSVQAPVKKGTQQDN